MFLLKFISFSIQLMFLFFLKHVGNIGRVQLFKEMLFTGHCFDPVTDFLLSPDVLVVHLVELVRLEFVFL